MKSKKINYKQYCIDLNEAFNLGKSEMSNIEKEFYRLENYKYSACRRKRQKKIFGISEGEVITMNNLKKLFGILK